MILAIGTTVFQQRSLCRCLKAVRPVSLVICGAYHLCCFSSVCAAFPDIGCRLERTTCSANLGYCRRHALFLTWQFMKCRRNVYSGYHLPLEAGSAAAHAGLTRPACRYRLFDHSLYFLLRAWCYPKRRCDITMPAPASRLWCTASVCGRLALPVARRRRHQPAFIISIKVFTS